VFFNEAQLSLDLDNPDQLIGYWKCLFANYTQNTTRQRTELI